MLDLLFGPSRRANGGGWDHGLGWYFGGAKTTAGTVVSEDLALTYAAYWCGLRIICETESSLPLFTYRRLTTDEGSGRAGDTQHAGDYYLYDLLKTAPNPSMGSMAFREGRTLHQVSFGNGFAEIEWDSYTPARRTRVVALWPIHPARVRPILAQGLNADLYAGGFRYLVRNNDGSQVALKPDEMLHVPGVLCEDGIWGKSCVAYHRETIGSGLAIEKHGAAYFGSGGQPRGIVYGTGLRDKGSRDNFRAEWKELHGRPDSGEIAILPMDAKYEKITVTNEDSQFLESRKFSVAQIARILRIPVYMLEEYEKAASFASVEQRSIDFVIGFLCWLRRWEEQCNLKLILPKDRATYFTEHNVGGLLRGDLASRMTAYVQALGNGIMTINEVRRLENLNSIGPAGDQHFVQLNMTTAERVLTGEMPPGMVSRPAPGMQDQAAMFDEWTKRFLIQQGQIEKPTRLSLAAPRTRAIPEAAVNGVLTDAFGRALTKLANALKREAGKVTDISAWLNGFMKEHGPAIEVALEPAGDLVEASGAAIWSRAIAVIYADLRAAFDTQTRPRFAEHLADWPSRLAKQIALGIETELETTHAP